MGKKGRKGADDWEKDFELDDEGNLAALKEEQPAEEAAPAAGKPCWPPGRPSPGLPAPLTCLHVLYIRCVTLQARQGACTRRSTACWSLQGSCPPLTLLHSDLCDRW